MAVVYLLATALVTWLGSVAVLRSLPSRTAALALSIGLEALLSVGITLGIFFCTSVYFNLWRSVRAARVARLLLKVLVVPTLTVALMIPASCGTGCELGAGAKAMLAVVGLLLADVSDVCGPLFRQYFDDHADRDIAVLFDQYPPARSDDLFRLDVLIWVPLAVMVWRHLAHLL
jgi:hypothetical protein